MTCVCNVCNEVIGVFDYYCKCPKCGCGSSLSDLTKKAIESHKNYCSGEKLDTKKNELV